MRRWHVGPLLTLAVIAAVPSPTVGRGQSGQPPVPASLQQVAQDVDSPDARVRRRALNALRERGGPESLALLGRLIGDEEVGIREGALDLAARIYVQPPPKHHAGSPEEAFMMSPYRVTPWPAPPELLRAVVRALGDEYPSVRRDSAYVLGIIAPPPLPPAAAFELLASLSDRDPGVRVAAALALGRLRVKSAGVALIGRVNDEVLDVRLAAMRALGDLRETSAVPALTDQFKFYVRGIAGRSALDALARIGDPSSAPLFEAETDSSYPAHRQSAYEGLARTGTAKVTAPRIEGALAKERDERVRLAMAFALASAGRPIAPVVDGVLDDDLAARALEYMVEAGPAHAVDLGTRLRDQNPVVRQHVAIALGFIGGPDAVAALDAAATDTSADVRNAVQVAQLRIRGARP
jgi:HEAT repeat protein